VAIHPDLLRQVMRQWTTGVSVVTSRVGDLVHGMTVSSFTSVSLEPPIVAVTLADLARTYELVSESGVFAVTILAAGQEAISDRFAGRIVPDDERFVGVPVFSMVTGCPLIAGGLAFLDCRVVHAHPLGESTVFFGEVLAAQIEPDGQPLVYHNRGYHRLIE
jgi:flavin reductase (DIM6/NTAB) family NADH-FMN oxidoreductase RutF